MADTIVLDRNIFRVLASETRLGILKNLDGKEITLSDLSRQMDMNKATLLEHLSIMIENGLVTRIEKEGEKFVYYKLTFKGSGILHPERMWVTVMLGGAALAFAGGVWSILNFIHANIPVPSGGPAPSTFDAAREKAGTDDILLYISIALFAACAVLIVIAALFRKRKRLEMEKLLAEKLNTP